MPEKLFGFKLTDTSALLLFIFSVGLLLIGVFYMYTAIAFYNETGTIPPMYFIISMTVLSLAVYILYKTLQQRKNH